MTALVVIMTLATCLALVWWADSSSKKPPPRKAIDPVQHAANIAAWNARAPFREQVQAFLEGEQEAWPAMHSPFDTPTACRYLMMSADQRSLRLVSLSYRSDRSSPVSADTIVRFRDVVSVELQQDSETITRLETIVEIKKRSGLGRAVVGGVLFGGVGAVVGAATAGSTTKVGTVSTSETRTGPIYLVIGTTDPSNPLHKLLMDNMRQAEVWLHRLRGGLAIAARE